MKVFVQIAHGIIGAALISIGCIWQAGSFGEARHTISIIGAVAILIASLYLLRSRWIRWGKRQVWLKYHQRLATLGLCLVLFHSAFQPLVWHSWLTLLLALANLGTGIAVSLTAHRTRQILLRCHLILAPILLISIVFHGQAKLDHDEFFPLTEDHDVPCARCHTAEPLLFHVDVTPQQDLNDVDILPEDIQWWFSQHGLQTPETAKVSTKKAGRTWTIADSENRRVYQIKKLETQLGIYADSVYQSYTCRTCHTHDTPEIRSAHELHGVYDYHRCLGCHQTEIADTRYGRQRVNWTYDPNW